MAPPASTPVCANRSFNGTTSSCTPSGVPDEEPQPAISSADKTANKKQKEDLKESTGTLRGFLYRLPIDSCLPGKVFQGRRCTVETARRAVSTTSRLSDNSRILNS